jgi:hypothetical protein
MLPNEGVRMDVIKAMEATLEYSRPEYLPFTGPCSHQHLLGMLAQMKEGSFSEAKLNRWLGWAQGVLVSFGLAKLDDMKRINLDAKR